MKLRIHGHNKLHPDIAMSLSYLVSVYHGLRKYDKALEKHEQCLEMFLAIHGREKPHPAIAMSLDNLGNVYRRLGRLEKSQEKHEQSLDMTLAIYSQLHSTILRTCISDLVTGTRRWNIKNEAWKSAERFMDVTSRTFPSQGHSKIWESFIVNEVTWKKR